jgi:hypothetical protein
MQINRSPKTGDFAASFSLLPLKRILSRRDICLAKGSNMPQVLRPTLDIRFTGQIKFIKLLENKY